MHPTRNADRGLSQRMTAHRSCYLHEDRLVVGRQKDGQGPAPSRRSPPPIRVEGPSRDGRVACLLRVQRCPARLSCVVDPLRRTGHRILRHRGRDHGDALGDTDQLRDLHLRRLGPLRRPPSMTNRRRLTDRSDDIKTQNGWHRRYTHGQTRINGRTANRRMRHDGVIAQISQSNGTYWNFANWAILTNRMTQLSTPPYGEIG